MIYRATDNSLQQAPHLVTRLPGPRAAAWIARDDQVMSPSYTRDYPLVVARGADTLVAGSSTFRAPDMAAAIRALREA